MTGLLCITALTNEHSNKVELKDQCVRLACMDVCVETVWWYICTQCRAYSMCACMSRGCVFSCDGERGNCNKGNEGREKENKLKKEGVYLFRLEIHGA